MGAPGPERFPGLVADQQQEQDIAVGLHQSPSLMPSIGSVQPEPSPSTNRYQRSIKEATKAMNQDHFHQDHEYSWMHRCGPGRYIPRSDRPEVRSSRGRRKRPKTGRWAEAEEAEEDGDWLRVGEWLVKG